MTQPHIGYLATNTGQIPFSAKANGLSILQNSGFNIGNLVFWHAARKMFEDPIVPIGWNTKGGEYKNRLTHLVIPASTFLRPDADCGVIADLIEDLGQEVIIFGLGGNAISEDDKYNLQPGTIRFLKAASAHAQTIFVRGEYSAEICTRYGIKNVEVLGCPSITISPQLDLGHFIESRYKQKLERLYFAGGVLRGSIRKIEHLMFQGAKSELGWTYVLQDNAELLDLAGGLLELGPLSEITKRAHDFLDPSSTEEEFRANFRRIARYHTSFQGWLEDAAMHDHSICTRIHGGMVSLMAGVPTIIVGHDTRIRELCKVMAIPCIQANEFPTRVTDVARLFEEVPFDGQHFDQTRIRIARRYREYLEARDFTPSQSLVSLTGLDLLAGGQREIKTSAGNIVSRGSEVVAHQQHNATEYNRYPKIFQRVGELCRIGNIQNGKILSYGCSTGEEALTLSNIYFPEFQITGVDISQSVIDKANRLDFNRKKINFFVSDLDKIAENGPYDVIFAMSVFCMWPQSQGVEDISSIYPFSRFEAGIEELDPQLRVGGFFVVANSNFDFRDTQVAANYKSISINIASSGFVERFNSRNKAVKLPSPPDCIFQKVKSRGL